MIRWAFGLVSFPKGERILSSLTLLAFLLMGLPAVLPVLAIARDVAALRALPEDLPRLGALLATTSVLGLGVLVVALPPGTLVALAAFRLNIAGRRVVWILLAGAAATPLALYAGAWQAWVGPYGVIDPGRLANRLEIRLLQALAIHSLAAVPWIAGVVGLGLLLGRRNLEDPARLETDTRGVLRSISLPLARPALVFAGLFALACPLTDMTVTDLYRIRTFAEEVYTELEERANAHAAALGNLLLAAGLGTAMAVLLARHAHGLRTSRSHRVATLPVDRSVVPIVVLAALGLLAVLIPFVGLFRQLGLTTSADTRTLSWSPAVALALLLRTASQSWRMVFENLLMAALSSCAASVLAVLVAWRLRSCGRWLTWFVVALLAWLVVLPGPILAMGLVDGFVHPQMPRWAAAFYDSRGMVICVQALRALPFVAAVWLTGLSRLEPSLLEAAALAGANGWRILADIVIPMLRPAATLAFLVGWLLALTELPASKLVAPPGVDVLMVRVFGLLHTGTSNEQAALCLVLLWLVGNAVAGAGCATALLLRRGTRT